MPLGDCAQVKTGKNDFKEIKKNKNKIKQHTLIYGSNFNVTNNLFITMTMMSKKQTNIITNTFIRYTDSSFNFVSAYIATI